MAGRRPRSASSRAMDIPITETMSSRVLSYQTSEKRDIPPAPSTTASYLLAMNEERRRDGRRHSIKELPIRSMISPSAGSHHFLSLPFKRFDNRELTEMWHLLVF